MAKQAFETYPNNPWFLRLLALNAYSAGDYKLAIKRFEVYRKNNEINESHLRKLGYAYYFEEDLDKSIEVFGDLLEEDQYDIEVLNNLGMLHNLKADYKEAEHYLTKAIFLKRDGLDKQYLNLGLTYKGQEKYKQAISYFRKSLAEDASLIRSQYELAICADNYYEDLQTRLNYYQKVITKFENNSNTKPYLESAEFRIKELRKEIFLKEEEHASAKEK